MPCFVALIALISPRLALFFVWIFSDWLSQAYDGVLLPVLGWCLLPWTTLAYAGMYVYGTNGVSGIEWFFVGLAFIFDVVPTVRGLTEAQSD